MRMKDHFRPGSNPRSWIAQLFCPRPRPWWVLKADGRNSGNQINGCSGRMQQPGNIDCGSTGSDDRNAAAPKSSQIAVRRAVAYQFWSQTGQNSRHIGEICNAHGDDDSPREDLLPILEYQFESGALSTHRCHQPILEIGHEPLLKCQTIRDKGLELNRVAHVAVRNSLLAAIIPQCELRFGIRQRRSESL